MKEDRRIVILIFAVVMISLALIPPVCGDGMPVYSYVRDDEEARTLYSTTFESRQLANVELLNDTHQKIDLFLSIFSLEPSQNLTVLVPFRERPIEIDMKEGTDSNFLDEHDYEKIKEESMKQDLGRTSKRFGERTGNTLQDLGTSAATTPLGLLTLHVAESYSMEDSYFKGEELGGGFTDDAGSVNEEVKEISHYEFDGASLSIYSVSANATLQDFISVVDLGTLPTVTREVVDEYKEQFVAVIETEPSPPISEFNYNWMIKTMPNTMEQLKDRLIRDQRISYSEAQGMVIDQCIKGLNEMYDNRVELYNRTGIAISDDGDLEGWGNINDFLQDTYMWEYDYDTPFDLLTKMEMLIFAVYGFTDFKGHTLSITTELNDGKLYFPLGTSKGWENPISETIIILEADEDTSLDLNIEPMHSAFIDNGHFYIVEYFDANPDEDLEASIGDVATSEKVSSSFSKFIHYNTSWAPLFIAILAEILLWFFLLWIFKSISKDQKGMKVATGKNLLIGAMNILVSAPVSYMFFVRDPFSGRINIEEKDKRWIYNLSFASYLGINVILLVWGMVA